MKHNYQYGDYAVYIKNAKPILGKIVRVEKEKVYLFDTERKYKQSAPRKIEYILGLKDLVLRHKMVIQNILKESR